MSDDAPDETCGTPDGDVDVTPCVDSDASGDDVSASDTLVLHAPASVSLRAYHRQNQGVSVTYLGP